MKNRECRLDRIYIDGVAFIASQKIIDRLIDALEVGGYRYDYETAGYESPNQETAQ